MSIVTTRHATIVRLVVYLDGETLRTRLQASDRVLLAPTGSLSDVDVGLIPECSRVRFSCSPEHRSRSPQRHRGASSAKVGWPRSTWPRTPDTTAM